MVRFSAEPTAVTRPAWLKSTVAVYRSWVLLPRRENEVFVTNVAPPL
jgi:hypothetical protein